MDRIKTALAVAAKIASTKEFVAGAVVGFMLGALHHYFGL